MLLQRMYRAFLHYQGFKSNINREKSGISQDATLHDVVVEAELMVIQFLTLF